MDAKKKRSYDGRFNYSRNGKRKSYGVAENYVKLLIGVGFLQFGRWRSFISVFTLSLTFGRYLYTLIFEDNVLTNSHFVASFQYKWSIISYKMFWISTRVTPSLVSVLHTVSL